MNVLHDETREGVRFIVIDGPFSLLAYVGVPEDHPLAGKHYDDIDLPCHGGLTFGAKGTGIFHPKDFWWYGWDYGHAGDSTSLISHEGDIEWTLEKVITDSQEAVEAFIEMVKEVS